MIASTTFQRVSIKLIPQVLVILFRVRMIIVQPRSVNISLFCHMYCVSSTSFLHLSGFGGVDAPSARYDSFSQFFK